MASQLFKRISVVCILMLVVVKIAVSQVNTSTDWEEIAEQFISDEEENPREWSTNFEDLEDLREHPLNINSVTKEQLERFPFLTDRQIEHLLYYLYIAGPMESIYELQLIEDMDRQTIQYLLPFVFVGKIEKKVGYPNFRELIKYSKNELTLRFDLPVNKKDGYQIYPDSVLEENPNKHYLGTRFYQSVKYSFRYKDLVYLGLNAEKDAGEPFFSGKNKKGFDSYSFYFFLRNFGKLKALALGNYRLSFGLGLVLSLDYNLGKSSSVSTINSRQTGIKKHSSSDEFNYFRGMAASYQLGKFSVSGFYSHRRLDAIVENGFITSIKNDGMHRTIKDFEKRNKAVNQLIGINFSYSYNSLHIGSTLVYNFFNKVLKPEIKPYSVFALQGKDFFNLGIDYSYRWNRFLFSGETAVDKGGSVATLNIVRFSPLAGYQLVLLQRSYSRNYQALFARSVAEGNTVRNENGFYIGLEAKPIKFWKFFAYADFFRFPWLKYGVDKPSSGFDGLIQATYSPMTNITMYGRYRYKKKDKNYRIEESGMKIVIPHFEHKFRYQLGFTLQENFSFRTTVDFVRIRPERKSKSDGFMLTQVVGYSFQQCPVQITVNYSYFDTDDYNSRLTIYERSILNAFSMPSFYGKGMRFALNLRYDINRLLTALVKIGYTSYADREEIGTGLERIAGSSKTDLYFQLRWKF